MRLTRVGDECTEGRECPAIYTTDRETIVVQGDRLDGTELGELHLAEGEGAVEIPVSLLEEAVRAYRK